MIHLKPEPEVEKKKPSKNYLACLYIRKSDLRRNLLYVQCSWNTSTCKISFKSARNLFGIIERLSVDHCQCIRRVQGYPIMATVLLRWSSNFLYRMYGILRAHMYTWSKYRKLKFDGTFFCQKKLSWCIKLRLVLLAHSTCLSCVARGLACWPPPWCSQWRRRRRCTRACPGTGTDDLKTRNNIDAVI